MVQETIQEERRRRKRHRRAKKGHLLKVRYKYHHWRTIRTPDYGTYEELYKRYKGKMAFFCADLPPEYLEKEGVWTGYRLDGAPGHLKATLERYGRHLSWIDPFYKCEGKPVVLVFNAGRDLG